jgi:hypothetical protein
MSVRKLALKIVTFFFFLFFVFKVLSFISCDAFCARFDSIVDRFELQFRLFEIGNGFDHLGIFHFLNLRSKAYLINYVKFGAVILYVL